nr:helix-turn-helix domain-containing protein [Streptomyces sp. NBC_00830]
MATRPVEVGPTGLQTAANIERLRTALGLSQRALAERLTELGRPMLTAAISRIERSERRIDVDDLAVFAAALGVSPATLLLPPVADETTVHVTGAGTVTTAHAWDWADGTSPLIPLPEDLDEDRGLAHALRARPEGRRADRLIPNEPAAPGPLERLTKQELLTLLDNFKEALLDG